MVVDDVLNAVGDVVDVLSGDSADGNTAILGHVDAMLLHHSLGLLNSESREGEHADLRGDVGPVALDTLGFNGLAKGQAHVVHSLADNDELVEPLLAHGGVVQDGTGDSGTMLGWARVVGPHDDLDLGEDTGSGGGIGAHKVEAAGTLTVETHDLGERLSNHHLEALAEEKTQAVSILVERARGETLVGGIKEGVELSALANISDLLPLGLSWVHTSGVVGARVQKHGRAGGCSL